MIAAAVAKSAVACGGAVATTNDSSGDTTSTTPGQKRPTTGTDPDVPSTADADVPDASPDVTVVDAQADQTVTNTCINGQVDPDPSFCCKDGDPSCVGGGGGDTGLCNLDCREVCKKYAPGSTGLDGWCNYTASATAPKVYYYCGMCGVGRVPGGTAGCERGVSVGERLAMQAYYEAASVIAFRRLAGVLVRAGAPSSLVRRARRAAAEERRHARLFAELARAYGAEPESPSIEPAEESLLALALENAREGQVRETYGALVAVHQAEHARDPGLRKAFGAIAGDELAHAELSWDLAAWFDTRLSTEERALVAAARAEATASLSDAATRDHDDVDAALGVPPPALGRMLFADLFAAIEQRVRVAV